MRSLCLLALALLIALPAAADKPAAEAAPTVVVVDTVGTTGPGKNRPWNLFAGEEWRAATAYEAIEFSFNQPFALDKVRLDWCAPPFDRSEPDVAVLVHDEGWAALDEGDDTGSPRNIVVEGDDVLQASWLKLQFEREGDCLAGLHLVGADGKDLQVNVVRAVGAKVHSEQSYGEGYDPHRLFDGDFATAWSTKGDGTGAELHFDFDEPQWITHVFMWPGYHRSEDLWQKNGLPTKLSVIVDGGEPQTWSIPTKMYHDDEPELRLKKRVKAKRLTLRLDGVRKGSKYGDTLISEMRFADGDKPFVPDPTTAYAEYADALRKKLGKAGLAHVVDQMVIDEDNNWYVGFLADGRLFVRHYVWADEGDYYQGSLSFEPKKVTKDSAVMRFYGALTRVPVSGGAAHWDKMEEKTVNGRMTLKAKGKGVSISVKGNSAKLLPLAGDYAIVRRKALPKTQEVIDAGFPTLIHYELRPSAKPDFELHFFSTKSLRLSGVPVAGAEHVEGMLDLERKELVPGRIVYGVSGELRRHPVKDGKPTRRASKKVPVEGELVVEKTAKGVRLTPKGTWAKSSPLPAGEYEVVW
jgi:hypothetical protein